MKTQIIAIGGGAMSNYSQTYPIEKYILEQTGKTKPNICFMPTASGDASHNIVRFYEIFGNLPCERTHLSLFSAPPDIESILMNQDIIYVGGGPFRNLLALWREWSLEKILYKAWKQGIILAGISSGATCWFEEGMTSYTPSHIKALPALGFLKGSYCAHYDSVPNNRLRYSDLISKGEIKEGVACEDNVALHYINGELHHVVSASPTGKAYQIKRAGDNFQQIELIPHIYL